MRANIHIRKENEGIWESIENKSRFVNDMLAMKSPAPDAIQLPKVPGYKVEVVDKGINAVTVHRMAPEITQMMKQKMIAVCNHGAAKGMCKYGCK